VEFRILGPLEVLQGDQTVVLAGRRERALLALLLLSANRVVSSERLAEDLWAGSPPEGATQTLRVYVSRLRRSLGEPGEVMVVTQPPGYLLRVEPEAVDAGRFEALVARARAEAAEGRHGEAAGTLREALALWRGPALADLADAPFARAETARLEEARLAALEERVEADLACGRHREVVSELDGLTRTHPLRERLWALRMLALYRSGRQADALRAYQDLRGVLGEELGLEPSAPLRRLESVILRQEPDLDWPTAPAVPHPEAPAAPAPGVATFLFTDLVGSTELLARLGDDAAEELRRTHFALLRRTVAEAGGQEVKSLGDGLMVTFASPLAALGCAVAIQRAIAEHNAGHPDPGLVVRVGLHAGEPVRAEDDYFGTTVVVARRLCDLARGGQILASELLAGLVSSRGGFRFHPLGRLALKGLPDPVPAVDVDWRPGVALPTLAPGVAEPPPPIPLPGLLTGAGRVFVDRESELDRLRVGWKEARAGRRRVLLVGGEPGVGKSRLAAALAGEVGAAGAVVLAGRCDEDLGVPYQPFVEAFRHLVDHTPDPHLVPRLGRFGGELIRLVPELAERIPGLPPPLRSDPETERYRFFDAVAAWVSATSSDAPVLLVLDDLQWAAKPTLLLLRHVVRSPASMRLLVVGTYRDTELGPANPLSELLADLRRDGAVERLSLSGLDEAGVLAVMERAAGHDLDEEEREVAHAVHQETEGNPFFVWEVLRHLAETGAVVRREGRWVTERPVAELGIPEGVRDVVGRRLSRLSEGANRMLAAGAVAGTEFDLPVLQAATGVGEETLLSAVEEAVGARLVTEAPGGASRYRFAHALVRATLYDGLSAARRTMLHRRLVEAIESIHDARLDDYLPALAHHCARGAAPGSQEMVKAVAYATRAGDRALAQLAHDEAVVWYRQARELLDASGPSVDEVRRCELLISLGEAQRRAGDPGYRETLLAAAHQAQELEDPVRLARAALANSRGVFSLASEVDADRVTVLEAAIQALGSRDAGLRARLLITLAAELEFSANLEQRRRLTTEALAEARRLGDPHTLGYVLATGYFPTVALLDVDLLEDNATQLVAVGEQLGDPALRFWGAGWGCVTGVIVGDLPAARRQVDAALRLAEELGQPFMRWTAMFANANLSLIAGRLSEAEALAQAAFDVAQAAGLPDAFRNYGGQLFWIRYEQGRLEELLPLLGRAVQRQGPFTLARAAFCLALCDLDRPEEARPVFAELTATGFALPLGSTFLYGMAMLAEVSARLGDAETAPLLLALLAPHHALVATSGGGSSGPVAHYLGLLATTLGRHDAAEAHFEEAARIEDRMGAPAWLARTRLEWARMLLVRRQPGDDARARDLLGQALTTARELGLGNVERRAAALLR
jgi:DNA-binding SARP family transcriptional activator/tetratricopeptide (TPR) repeat protein